MAEAGPSTPTVEVYTCKYCQATFPESLALGRHALSEHKQTAYTCDRCSATFPDSLALARHVHKEHPREMVKKEEQPEARPPTTEEDILKGLSPREYVAQFGAEGLAKLKRKRLADFLEDAPDVIAKTKNLILKNYDPDPTAQRDIGALYNLLTSTGVKDNTAHRICNILASLEAEFRDIPAQGRAQFYVKEASYQPCPARYP